MNTNELMQSLPEPDYAERKMQELLASIPDGTVVTTEALLTYPGKTPLHEFFLLREVDNLVVRLVGLPGEPPQEYKTFAGDAFILYLIGYPYTIENNVLTVTIAHSELKRCTSLLAEI